MLDRYFCDSWHIGVYSYKTIKNLINSRESKGKNFANPFAKHSCKTRLHDMFAKHVPDCSTFLYDTTWKGSCAAPLHHTLEGYSRDFYTFVYSPKTFVENEFAGQWCKDTRQRSYATVTPSY